MSCAAPRNDCASSPSRREPHGTGASPHSNSGRIMTTILPSKSCHLGYIGHLRHLCHLRHLGRWQGKMAACHLDYTFSRKDLWEDGKMASLQFARARSCHLGEKRSLEAYGPS